MHELTSARMRLAVSTAALTMSTETPRLQKPWRSGGLTWIIATSTFTRPFKISCGISERKTGMKSARPSCTAERTFFPMKKAMWRKRPSSPGATYGAGPSVSRCTISLPHRCVPSRTIDSTRRDGSDAPEPIRMRVRGGIALTASAAVDTFQRY